MQGKYSVPKSTSIMESEYIQAVVIDNGGDTIKAGFHKDCHPQTVFPNLVGRLIHKGFGIRNRFGGYEALGKGDLVNITNVIEDGLITNWDDIEAVWHHTFYDCLCIAPEETPVLLTEPPLFPKESREKMTQIMFETFNTPALYCCSSSLLSLYGTGRVSGIVVDTGHTTSSIVPIIRGNPLLHAITKLETSGSQLTRYLTNKLSELNSYAFDTRSDRDRVRHFKESLSYVSLNYQHDMEMELSGTVKSSYQLPDGKEICFGSELFRIPETLFQPSLCSAYSATSVPDSMSIQQSVCSSIHGCSGEYHKQLCNNIVLSGGNSLFPGFRERLEREVSLLCPNNPNRIRVIAPAERKHLAWIGGASITSLTSFNSMWLTKEEYDESGPSPIIRKMF